MKVQLDLSGKTALVCGASAGIGRATAIAFAQLGARVILVARTEAKLRELAQELTPSGAGGHRVIACDVNDHALLEQKVKSEIATCGGIDILVNNVGGPKAGPLASAALEDLNSAFHQHILTYQKLAQLIVPSMKERGGGRIINVVSTSVRQPIANLGVSNTIRAATAGWAKTLSNELGPFNITVNNVLPGATKTDRLESIIATTIEKTGRSREDVIRDMEKATPIQRFAEAEELAGAIAYLASPIAGFVTGVSLPVDGGKIGSI